MWGSLYLVHVDLALTSDLWTVTCFSFRTWGSLYLVDVELALTSGQLSVAGGELPDEVMAEPEETHKQIKGGTEIQAQLNTPAAPLLLQMLVLSGSGKSLFYHYFKFLCSSEDMFILTPVSNQ